MFHGLTGYGIQWGRVKVDADAIRTGDGNTFKSDMPDDWPWEPDAMLREPEVEHLLGMPCVGEEYEIVPERKEEE